jgi:3-oxoacyl-[acyl-carrier-protein] synthase II
MKRVVVTGLGALTPIGNNVNAYWKSLIEGKSGAAPITKFDAEKFKTKFACELKGFDYLNHLEKSEARKYDAFTIYALVAAEEAIKHAQINFDVLNKNKIGVIWGSGNGGFLTFQEQVMEFAKGDGTPRFNPFFIPKFLPDIASGVISMKYGLRGVNFTTISACASANSAIIEAFNYIKWGKADMVITGGSEAPISESGIGGFNALKALSTLNEDPILASRPFDVNRDGFVMGEGAAAIILESYESAIRRNATILAEVVGGAMTADAYHLTGTHPEGEGAYLGMLEALSEANISPEEIDYMNAHATSTPQGDMSELKAIQRVFGNSKKMSISATKSMTGHLLGAAGAIEGVATIKSIMEDVVPPTMNTKDVEPEIDGLFDLTLGKAKTKKVNYAMSNTFGFGGHIATSVFKKFEE